MSSRRHNILWWYHVNKYRAMRGNRSELAPGRKSPRCHVNTPLEKCTLQAEPFLTVNMLCTSFSVSYPLKKALKRGSARRVRELQTWIHLIKFALYSIEQIILCSAVSLFRRVIRFTTVFVDTRLWETKLFQNFPQSCVIDRSDRNPPITAH